MAKVNERDPAASLARSGSLTSSTGEGGTVASTIVTVEADKRSERYRLRRVLWRVSSRKRFQTCGRAVRGDSVSIRVSTMADGSRRGSAHGLVSCGSIWSCPVCSPHLRADRQHDVSAAIDRHAANGGGLLFLTLTLRHTRQDGLADLMGSLYQGWRRLQQHRAWRQQAESLGFVGWIRAAEVTWGWANGWHPHLHVLLFTAKPVEPWQRDDLDRVATDQWLDITADYGLAGLDGIAVDLKRVQPSVTIAERLGGYAVKGEKAHLEVTRGDIKRPWKRDRWSAFEILEASSGGEVWALERWWEYEKSTHNRRAIEWSRKLRKHLGLDSERTEAEVLDDAITDDAVTVEDVIEIEAAAWAMVAQAHLDWDVLQAAVESGAVGVCCVIEAARDYATRRARDALMR